MTHPWSTRQTALAATLLLSLGACNTSADQGEPADGIFVARAGEIMIAAVAVDDLVAVYACDGRADAEPSLSTWFYGQLDGGAGTLSNDDGATIDLTIGADLSGALHLASGEPTDFTGAAVADDAAGLYWGEQDDWVGGWIIDDAGEQRGAVLKRNTGNVAFISITPTQSSVTLPIPSLTEMAVKRMMTPKDLR